jgi:outer membrane protein OmpA-like peptidoglycan-associated protein
MNAVVHAGLGVACLLIPTALVGAWTVSAANRIAEEGAEAGSDVAVAAAADEGYCTADLRKVLRRVLQSCGLQTSGEVRGCKPTDAKSVATMSGEDFNALFRPLADRAGIIQFDLDSSVLDPADIALLDKQFADQRGASWFLVVARASPEGSELHNQKLSQERGQAVLDHLRQTFTDPDLDKEVGLLWLGEEFAQLEAEFCTWPRSGAAEECSSKDLNRSAFVTWIDCRI